MSEPKLNDLDMTASQYLRSVLADAEFLRNEFPGKYVPNGYIWHGDSLNLRDSQCHICLGGIKIAMGIKNPNMHFDGYMDFSRYCYEKEFPISGDELVAIEWLDSVRLGNLDNWMSRQLFDLSDEAIEDAESYLFMPPDYYGWDEFETVKESINATASALEAHGF